MASFHCSELRSHTASQNSRFVKWTHVKQQPNSSRGGHSVRLSGTEQTPAAVRTQSAAATTLTTLTPQSYESKTGHLCQWAWEKLALPISFLSLLLLYVWQTSLLSADTNPQVSQHELWYKVTLHFLCSFAPAHLCLLWETRLKNQPEVMRFRVETGGPNSDLHEVPEWVDHQI